MATRPGLCWCAMLMAGVHFAPQPATADSLQLDPRTLHAIGRVDERFQSYNLEFSAITGGRFWAPFGKASKGTATPQPVQAARRYAYQPPLDLMDRRLRTLASALGPAYVRISGTSANSVYFQDDRNPPLRAPPKGFRYVLTCAEWKGVIDFAKAVNAKILTSFTISSGVRDASGTWTPAEAAPLIRYTHAIGGRIAAAELFNEPNLPTFGDAPKGYDAAQFARDEAVFRAFAQKAAPGMKIVGPGDVVAANVTMPGGITASSLMSTRPRPGFDIVSYHYYPGVSARCAPPQSPFGADPRKALSEEWLASVDRSFRLHEHLRDLYDPGAPIWDTETGGAACGGAPWDATFLDSFRYTDMRGRLARQGLDALFHQTLVGSNYGLLDEKTYEPRPNYWAALLWRRLMGRVVLDAGPIHPGLHVYAQCQRGQPGGVSVLAINLRTSAARISLSGWADVYALTARTLRSVTVLLNGRPFALGPRDRIPALVPRRMRGRDIPLAPTSITFIALPGANNASCAAPIDGRRGQGLRGVRPESDADWDAAHEYARAAVHNLPTSQ